MVIALGKAGKHDCKNTHFSALPRAMTVALDKGQALPRAWLDWPSAKSFPKKRKFFAEGLRGFAESLEPSAKPPAPVVTYTPFQIV
jgi:hypothetical protein